MSDLFLYLLIPLSFAMGFVNSITGGGGVFGVPALLAMGFPPVNALALNRISDFGYIAGSVRNYMRIPDFRLKFALMITPFILVGAFIGANIVIALDPEMLNIIIVGAVLIGVFFLLYPFQPKEDDTARPHYIAGFIGVFLLGLWDGAFAMAGGTFGVLILVLLFHRSYLGAKSIMTTAAVPETVLSMAILWSNSTVDLEMAGMMFFSSIVGAYIGSKLAIKRGSRFIRYAMIAMALVMVAKLLVFDIFKLF